MNLKTLKLGQSISVEAAAKKPGKKSEFNNEAIKLCKNNSHGLPPEIVAWAKKGGMLFIHSYPDLDAVLKGMNVIGCLDAIMANDLMIIVDAKQMKAKEGDYIFIGAPRLKGVAKAYVEKIVDGKAYISGNGGSLEK